MKKSVFTVENAKVANIIYKFYSRGTNGFIKDADKLVNVSVSGISVDLKNQVVTSVLKDVNGNEYERVGQYTLYNSPKDFECNNPREKNIWRTFELLKRANWGRLCECACPVCDVDDEKKTSNTYLEVWIFGNGEAINVPAIIHKVEINDDNHWRLVEGQLPEKYWESRDDAYSCNEYKVVDSDGEEFIEQGISKRLNLTPEQWEIMHTLTDTFKKAKDAGIKLVWDREYLGTIKAFNMSYVSDIEWQGESDRGSDVISIRDVCFADTEICFYDYNGSDSDDRIILKPTARQLKEWKKSHPDCSED